MQKKIGFRQFLNIEWQFNIQIDRFPRIPDHIASQRGFTTLPWAKNDAFVKSRISDDFVKSSQARRANPEE